MKISAVGGALSFFLAPVMSVAGVSAKAPGRLSLYDDDGKTVAFENGLKWSYSEVTWTLMNSAGGKSP